MPSRKSYNRFFIILQEDQRGYGLDTSKTPSGYAKLETMNDRAKASFYVQNLKRQKGPFNMVLIVDGKNRKELINLGSINIDDMGKADISNEYSSDNIANTNISMDKVQGAAICRISSDTIVPVMVGFAGGEELNDWSTYPIAAVSDKREKSYSVPLKKTVKQEKREEVKENREKKNVRSDVQGGTQSGTQNCNPEELARIRAELEEIRREKEDLEDANENLTTELDKLRLDMENLEQEKNKLNADRLQLNKDMETFNSEKEAYQSVKDALNKEKLAFENEKKDFTVQKQDFAMQKQEFTMQKQAFEKEKAEFKKMKECFMKDKAQFEAQMKENTDKNKCSICKFIKVKRDDEPEEGFNENSNEFLRVDNFDYGDSEGQSFEEYEDEIEQYKNYRNDRGKKHKGNKDKDNKCMNKCKTYPKEKKEEFFNGVVKDLEKVGKKENIKNCDWYKANVDKLESMYCIYDYNKYAVIFYPMICYYPYIAKSGNFLVGYKYDDDDKLRYIIYAIPGTKELRDQPYEGKTGFVTFMPEDYDNNRGYWLMYYDIDENTVVVPVKRG